MHTRDAATRNMEKVQVIKVRLSNAQCTKTAAGLFCQNYCSKLQKRKNHFMFVNLRLQDFPWIVADEQEVHMQEPRLIPLKTMTSDIVKVSRKIPLSHYFNSPKTNIDTEIRFKFVA